MQDAGLSVVEKPCSHAIVTFTMRQDNRTLRIITSGSQDSLGLRANALWLHRELIYFLAWRDIKVRYKQTALGVVWVVLQPLAIALVLTVSLGQVVKLPPTGLPYPVFVFSAMVVWLLFANVLTETSNSLPANERLISKVGFPRLVIPLSLLLASLPDFLIGSAVLGLFFWHYHMVPAATFWFAPLFIVVELLTALGIGLWLGALNVKYRDVRYTVNFLVQFWFFASPIAYPASVVPHRWQNLYALNPMVGILEGLRWSLTGKGPFPAPLLGVSVAITLVLLLTGLFYFVQTEDTFADFI
jgi:homopolymeric O-antigen transport system permease protein